MTRSDLWVGPLGPFVPLAGQFGRGFFGARTFWAFVPSQASHASQGCVSVACARQRTLGSVS